MYKPRILVIGAGVNGSAVSASLFRGGVDVSVLARGTRLEELQRQGIVIENPFNQKRTVTRVPVIDHLDPQDIYDFILVVVRKNQVRDVLPILAQNRSPNIVFMGNNLLGPGEFISVLGKERVMMGSMFAGGRREGSLIHAIVLKFVAAPFGEIDGTITPRLRQLADILHQGGFKVELCEDIVDTQMTHGVGVAILATMIMKHGGSVRRLARVTIDLWLIVAARREGHRVIRALGHRVLPRSDAAMVNIPGFIQVLALRMLLNSKLGVVGLEYHISQAPDEMRQLAMELNELVKQARIPTPALQKVLG